MSSEEDIEEYGVEQENLHHAFEETNEDDAQPASSSSRAAARRSRDGKSNLPCIHCNMLLNCSFL